MCAIASILVAPTNPAESASNYIVSVDGSEVKHNRSESVSNNGERHSTLTYQRKCTARNIRIAANNTCGMSQDVILDPDTHVMLTVDVPGSAPNVAGNIECKQE